MTTITDPRGDDGSPEAQHAIAVHEAAVEMLAGDVRMTPVRQCRRATARTSSLNGHLTVPEGECTET